MFIHLEFSESLLNVFEKLRKKEREEWIKKNGNKKISHHEDIEKMCFKCNYFYFKYPLTKQIPVCYNSKIHVLIIDLITIGTSLIYHANPFCECIFFKEKLRYKILKSLFNTKVIR